MKAVLLAAAALLRGSDAAIAKDQITNLPGFGTPLSAMYSGYLAIPGGKFIHYVFTEALNSPATAPVTLWLNGGPGCSSMEGAFQELGLYSLGADGATLTQNPWSWGNATNLLYLEAPAGVGFSYATTPAGTVTNDTQTATDNLNALLAFFAGFPEYASNDFWISGESYAGVYVPTLAYAIYNHNLASPAPLPLRGLLVGNGCTGTNKGVCGGDPTAMAFNIEQWRGHGLISYVSYIGIYKACGDFANPSPACYAAIAAAQNEIGDINVYDIYTPCVQSGSSRRLKTSARRRPLTVHEQAVAALADSGPVECIDGGALQQYLTSSAALAAFHVSPAIDWHVCSSNLTYTPTEPDVTAVIYPTLLSAGLRVLIYNGEADACVPFTDNEAWTSGMGYPVASPWQPWMSDDNDVGGYVTQYSVNGSTSAASTFTFTTIRGAGHMVPEYQPKAAWVMFTTWIQGGVWPGTQ